MLVVNNTKVADNRTSYQSITVNLTPKIRHDKMNGEEYWVVPMVMLTEGVHAGSNGPLYYSPDELGKTPVVWNHKPIVVYHPEANGQAISACDVDVINTRGVGVIMGTKFEGGKLKGEAWLRPNRLKEVDERIYKAIENGTPMEVSTGLFTDNDDEEGEWNGEKYKAIARNFRPDHLAILPDQKGACSLADGAGLLRNADGGNDDLAKAIFNRVLELARNEMSDSERAQQLSALLMKGNGIQSAWPVDVYDTYFIYSDGGKYYKQEYTTDGDKLALKGAKQEVFRTTQYKTSDGTVVGNKNKENNVDKSKLVDALIANGAGIWTEADREFLMGKDEKFLSALQVKSTQNQASCPKDLSDAEKAKWEKMSEEERVTWLESRKEKTTENAEVQSAEQFIATAPPVYREMLTEGLAAHNATKAELIKTITANKANIIPVEHLQAKSLSELRGIAALAGGVKPTQPTANYAGLADGRGANDEKHEPLVAPVMNFDPAK